MTKNTKPVHKASLKEIWSGRCPVPTATGLALKLGWLKEEFAADGIEVFDRREQAGDRWRTTYGTELVPPLFREGGAIPALIGKAQGEHTRLIGLTWIDEWQTILVHPQSGITSPAQLKSRRLAVPAWGTTTKGRRSSSIARGMSLHGYKNVLDYAGLDWRNVTLVEVGSGDGRERESAQDDGLQGLWAGIAQLAKGEVDAVYVKGASAVDAARKAGVVVGIDLDALPTRRARVNNGTPRPLTVPEYLLDDHFDVVVRYLAQTIRVSEWAKENEAAVHRVLQGETRGGADAVATAYRNGFHTSLHPDLSEGRLGFFAIQKDFLLLHGFLDKDFSVAEWADHRPLEAAWTLYREWQRSGRFEQQVSVATESAA